MFIIRANPINDTHKRQGIGFGKWIKTQLAYWFIGNNLHLHDKTHPQPSQFLDSKHPRTMGLFRQTLLMTFPCDGYDISNHTITDFSGKVTLYDGNQSFATLILTTFFGLPNRPLYDAGKFQFPWQFIAFNFFGGFDFSPNISTEKRIWQTLSILFKILIIFPLKVISIIPKIALNILKIFTELLPTYAAFLCAYGYRQLFKQQKTNGAATAAMIVVSFLHFLTKTISLIGRMITSPEKNARLAVAFAHEIKGRVLGLRASTIIGFIVGTASVAFTAILWATLLPLAFGLAIKLFPAAMNTAYQAFLWFSNLPVIAQSLNLLNSIFVPVITALNSIIAPIVLPLANYISLQVAANLFYIGTAIGLLAFPITFLSRVADDLSNAWVKWHKSGPFTQLFSSSSASVNTIKSASDHSTSAASASKAKVFDSAHLARQGGPSSKPAPQGTPSTTTAALVTKNNIDSTTASTAANIAPPKQAALKPLAEAPATRSAQPVENEHWATQMFRGETNRMLDQRKYDAWYLAALMPVLMNAGFRQTKTSPILYFAHNDGHKNVPIPYSHHVKCLAEHAADQNKNAIMISSEPGINKNHFVITLITPSRELFLINLTTSKHDDPMQILRRLKTDDIIAKFSIYNSKTPLQHDDGSVVSCGPLCIEVARFIANHDSKIIAQIKAQQQPKEDHFEFDLIGALGNPELERLASLDPVSYRRRLVEIRESHNHLLGTLNDHAVDHFATQQDVTPLVKASFGLQKEHNDDDEFDHYVDDFDHEEDNCHESSEDDDSGNELMTHN